MNIQMLGQRAVRLAAVGAALWIGLAFAGPLMLGYAPNDATWVAPTFGNQAAEDTDTNSEVSPAEEGPVISTSTRAAA